METVLNSCRSSVSYVISGIEKKRTTKDLGDSLPYGKVYSALSHSTHFSRGNNGKTKAMVANIGAAAYIPCNFPSTPLSCSGSAPFNTNIRSESRIEWTRFEETSSPDNILCETLPLSPDAVAGYDQQRIALSNSPLTCPSIPLRPWASNSGGEGQWVRPLGYAERFMTMASRWGNMSTVYALWLDSQGPISLESIKRTSYLILRKMPHLNMCVGQHKNDNWWKRMDTVPLDVEEIQSDEDVLNIYESLLKHRYNIEEGPLWFVRFLTSVNRNDLVMDNNSNPKHKYVVIFGFHHNVTDGTTNMKFCNIFVSLLNDVIQNKAPDLSEEGIFAFPIHDDLANAAFSYKFLLRLFALRIYKGIIAYCAYVKNFIEHYPMPNEHEGCTRVLQNEFDEITTERLLKRCKMEGVTLNSAFTAASNIGMLRMILERDGSVEETQFDSQQTVNMRRYWPKDKQKNAFGCHISMIDIQIPTKKEDIRNFWEYARRVHGIIYNELNTEKRIIKIQPLSQKLCLAIFINSWLSKFRLASTNDSHYCITNMGNVSSLFTGNGQEVNVSKMLRSVSCHFMQSLCQHTLQTFKGKFYYALDYYPQKMSVDTARAYASSLMDTLRTSIHMPN